MTQRSLPHPRQIRRSIQLVIIAASLIASMILLFSCVRHINPTEIGLKISKLGNKRGVTGASVISGYTLVNPITTEIATYPGTQVSYTWTRSSREQSSSDESLNFNSGDSVQFSTDVNFAFQINRDQAPAIFKRFGPNTEYIVSTYIRNVIRDQLTRKASLFTSDQILGHQRAEFVNQVESGIKERLTPDGFIVQNFSLNQITPPSNISDAINAKIKAQQDAVQAQNKVAQSQAEAQQEVAKAKGDAQAILVRATSQAQANLIIAQSLTPELIQSKLADRWDGHGPSVVSGAGGSFIQIPWNPAITTAKTK